VFQQRGYIITNNQNKTHQVLVNVQRQALFSG